MPKPEIPHEEIIGLNPEGVEVKRGFWVEHKLSLLLVIAVAIALILTTVSVALYETGGAAQLDLSRPGYQAVSDQVEYAEDIDEFSSRGDINLDTLNEFLELYGEQADKATSVDAFNGDPLNPELLQFANPKAADEASDQ